MAQRPRSDSLTGEINSSDTSRSRYPTRKKDGAETIDDIKQAVITSGVSIVIKQAVNMFKARSNAAHKKDILPLLYNISMEMRAQKSTWKKLIVITLMAIGFAFLGSLLRGRIEITVGTTVGAVLGTILGIWVNSIWKTPATHILDSLNADQRERLNEYIFPILSKRWWTDSTELTNIVNGNADLLQKVKAALVYFIYKELNVKIV